MSFKIAIFAAWILSAMVVFSAENRITVIDTTNGGLALQEYFGKVFGGDNIPVPQELEVNIIPASGNISGKLPVDTVIADDGLSGLVADNTLARTVYAAQPVIIAVSKNNPLDNLDVATLKRIFSGRVGIWSRIGVEKGRIIIAGAAHNSAAGRVFRKLVMQQDLSQKGEPDINSAVAPGLILCREQAAAAALLQTCDDVIVFGGAELTENVQKKYKILKVNNVYPSRENVFSGKYTLASQHSILFERNRVPSGLEKLLSFFRTSVEKNGNAWVVPAVLPKR